MAIYKLGNITGVYKSRFIKLLAGFLLSFLLVSAHANSPPDPSSTTPIVELQQEQASLFIRYISVTGGGGETSDGELTINGSIGQSLDGDSESCGLKISNSVWSIIMDADRGPIFGNSFEYDPRCD